MLATAPAAPAVKAPVDPKVTARRQAAMDALKQRFSDGKVKAKEHVDAGNRAKAAGDYLAAAESFRAALAITPNDPEIKAAHEEMLKASAEKLVEANRKKAMLEERFGRWAEAAESWQRVVTGKPDDAEARDRLAQALARAARDG
jgi:tetratricopeptide (TPR) repeat protein